MSTPVGPRQTGPPTTEIRPPLRNLVEPPDQRPAFKTPPLANPDFPFFTNGAGTGFEVLSPPPFPAAFCAEHVGECGVGWGRAGARSREPERLAPALGVVLIWEPCCLSRLFQSCQFRSESIRPLHWRRVIQGRFAECGGSA